MLELDYKTNALGETTEFILLGMNRDQVKCMYGALLKERQHLQPLVEHFKYSENDLEGKKVFQHLTQQKENIDRLIEVLKRVH